MAFDRLFCPIRSSRSARKSSSLHQTNNRQNEATQQADNATNHRSHNAPNSNSSSNNNNGSSNTTSNSGVNPNGYTNSNIPYKYVISDFQRVEQDEITAMVGDLVLYEFSDIEDGKSWSYVSNLTRNERGFVPSDILSNEREPSVPCIKKKLPRSMNDHPRANHHHGHQHGRAHSHRTHCTSERTCHSNGGSIKLHQAHHMRIEPTPQFDLAFNSLQGSSGCQTFQKFPDFPFFAQPSYHNINAPHMGPQFDECQIIPVAYREYGSYVVLHNFVAREENDLEVNMGEFVEVLNKDDEDWFWVRRYEDDRHGFVPAKFIVPAGAAHDVMNKGNSTVTMKSSNKNDFHTYINHAPERDSLNTDQQSSVPVLFPG
jgi:hypothetical protein